MWEKLCGGQLMCSVAWGKGPRLARFRYALADITAPVCHRRHTSRTSTIYPSSPCADQRQSTLQYAVDQRTACHELRPSRVPTPDDDGNARMGE